MRAERIYSPKLGGVISLLSLILLLTVSGLAIASPEADEPPESFYPKYKWVTSHGLVPLSREPINYRGTVYLEQEDFKKLLKILGIMDWHFQKGYRESESIFVYEDIPPVRVSFEPLMYNGVYIPFKVIRKALGYELIIDEQGKRIWIVPSLKDIIVREDAVILVFSGKLKVQKTFYLPHPLRFVIDIENAAVSPDLFRKMEIKSHKYVRSIRTSQFTTVPPIVRVVLDLKQKARVYKTARIRVNTLHVVFSEDYEIGLTIPKDQPVKPKPGEEPIHILQLTPSKSGNQFALIVKRRGEGKLNYSIKQLKDNRCFMDIYNAVLDVSKNSFRINYGGVKVVRYSQYQRKPVPVVRIVIESSKPGNIVLKRDSSDQFILGFLMKPETVLLDERVLGTVICIDPGHGGSDPGARCPYMHIDEKDITLQIGLYLERELRKLGFAPVMTRHSDREVLGSRASDADELQARVDIARNARAKVFISIHINASPNRYLDGIMTFYHKEIDYPLARAIHDRLTATGLFTDRGIRSANFYVLRKSTMPAVLLELGFITNRRDAKKLMNIQVRRKLARAIAQGIADYFKGHYGKRD